MKQPTSTTNLLASQESIISSTKRTLAKALKIEVSKIKVGHNYKKNCIELQVVDEKLDADKTAIVAKAQEYLQTLLTIL